MSSVVVPIYHYALLKGYFSGQNAPSEVLVAVEALYIAAVQGPLREDALDAIQSVREAAERLTGIAEHLQPVEMSIGKPELRLDDLPESAEFDLPPITRRALEKAAERAESPVEPSQLQTDEAKIAAFLTSQAAEQCPAAHAAGAQHEAMVGLSEPKKRKEWSPEARAAAAERMRTRQAAGLMKGRKKLEQEAIKPGISDPGPTFGEEELRIRVPVKRRNTRLSDEHWPEIKARIAEGDSREAIAGDYEEEIEDLDFFIQSCERREAKLPPGEARAPL